jgi:hypothetical protein
MIRKVKAGYRVITHKSGRNMGTYKTKKEAEARLKQLKRFSKIKL